MSDASESSPLPRVLIVDDSRIVRATIIKHLKGRYRFREETDGEAGWAALVVDREIDVVLTDLSMPKLDGYGLIERVRASTVERIRNLPVVLISGDEDEFARERAKTIGATDFITKGIGTAELLSRLDSLVSLSKVKAELFERRERQIRHSVSGLFSASYIDEQAATVFAFATRHHQPATVFMVGIDGIESITETYGAGVSTQLNHRFGQLLNSKVRKDDSLGHYGEHFFVLLSPVTPDGGSLVFAERLRVAVEASNVAVGGKPLPVTVSIGISTVPIDSVVDPSAWVALAGERMRCAAEAGGNRIVGPDVPVHEKPKLPTIDDALATLAAGHGGELQVHALELALTVLPILGFANEALNLGLSMQDIEKRLRDRENSTDTSKA